MVTNHLHGRLLVLGLLLRHSCQVLPKQEKFPLKLWVATRCGSRATICTKILRIQYLSNY